LRFCALERASRAHSEKNIGRRSPFGRFECCLSLRRGEVASGWSIRGWTGNSRAPGLQAAEAIPLPPPCMARFGEDFRASRGFEPDGLSRPRRGLAPTKGPDADGERFLEVL
jgi:hypothetical protein